MGDDAVDSDPNNATVSGVDADNDGVDDAVDSDPNNATVSGVDADNDGVDDAVDADPTDPSVSDSTDTSGTGETAEEQALNDLENAGGVLGSKLPSLLIIS